MCEGNPRLRVPQGMRIPTSTRRLSSARPAFSRYRDEGFYKPICINWEDFELVWKYCDMYDDPALLYLEQDKIPGYSVYIHELIELEWYFEKDLHPYNRPLLNEEESYGQAHSHALIAEHRYLQEMAKAEGEHFSLHELIQYNPVAGDPKRDWIYIREYRASELFEFDQSFRCDYEQRVTNWYQRKGFSRGL